MMKDELLFCWHMYFVFVYILGLFPLLVKTCLCFSLFFTYPIMMFPVLKIMEDKLLPGQNTEAYLAVSFKQIFRE